MVGMVPALVSAALLILFDRQTSDIGAVRLEEMTRVRPFEYPVLARLLYLGERALSGSILGISLINVGVGVAGAVAMALLLRRMGADYSLWVAAPLLVLAGQNWDVITALTIALAMWAWLRGADVDAGVWVGIGTAFKIVPIVLLVPMLALGGWRRTLRAAGPAAVLWIAVNLPSVLRNPTAWTFPYKFASERTDVRGTLWAALPLRGGALNMASLVLLALCLGAVFVAAARRRLTFAPACALAILAFIGTNKVWQPHYVLWALPALAICAVGHRWVRGLEWASLLYFADIWRRQPQAFYTEGLWIVGSLRFVALLAVAVAVVLGSLHKSRVPADL